MSSMAASWGGKVAEVGASPHQRKARSSSFQSLNAGASNCTPNGSPSERIPAGTATAHRSSRLVMLVKRPSSLLTPTGSAVTSARVGWLGVTGISRASSRSHVGSLCRRSPASWYMPAKVSTAVKRSAWDTIARTVGSMWAPSVSRCPNAEARSASQGPV